MGFFRDPITHNFSAREEIRTLESFDDISKNSYTT
jgi:hypothetical protein